MNEGLGYDPTLGRFLQADPHIKAPKNSQSYNRYSYVLNNPMSYTDPSGYLFKKFFKVDFPDFIRHPISYIVTSTRGVYEQRQTVYPRI